jgi:hypothetical protein
MIPITNGIEANIAKIAVSVSDSIAFANSFILILFSCCCYNGSIAGGTDILTPFGGVSGNYFCELAHSSLHLSGLAQWGCPA